MVDRRFVFISGLLATGIYFITEPNNAPNNSDAPTITQQYQPKKPVEIEREVRYVFLDPRPDENVRNRLLNNLKAAEHSGDPFSSLDETFFAQVPALGLVYTTIGHPYACLVFAVDKRSGNPLMGTGKDQNHDGYFETVEIERPQNASRFDSDQLVRLLNQTRSKALTSPDLVQIIKAE